jgi:UDP-N-acetylglucosamine 2-epimerase (non-hydrolysing)
MTSQRGESLTGTSSFHSVPADSRKRVLVIFGTRPEAIKLGPLLSELQKISASGNLEPVVCVTGQHREMLDQVLRIFQIQPDFDLQVMHPGQSLPELTARLMSALTPVFAEVNPALTVVQGDTTTTFCGALSSFYARVPVAHIEAGLRTYDRRNPFPEEMNRVLTCHLAALHFPPTPRAAGHLVREGIAKDALEITGNTGIDAVLSIRDRLQAGEVSGLSLGLDPDKKTVLITAHRRENFGPEFQNICKATAQLAMRDDVQVVWPVHRNPNVAKPVAASLSGRANVFLVDPLDYLPFVDLMRRAYLIITDSGGIQEEAPSLGKPVLVLRNTTERPEAVEAGTVKMVGTDPEKILQEATRLLEDMEEYERMARLHNPYGDGRASYRIARRIAVFLRTPLP